jgi:putative ABC transport system ATP-binding protein
MSSILKITGLRHAYGRMPVLHVEAFQLAAGEHAVILGPSGCGKSTLLHLIAGILTPQAGQVLVAGTDVVALAPRAADAWRGRTVGFLPQRLALVPSLSIRENILLTAYATGEAPDGARADALLYALGLADKAASKPGQLSQGQQQRAAIARALYHRPQLLLADEPTANLDDAACWAAVRLLTGQAAEADASLVMATHDARVLAALPQAKVLRLDMLMREAA